MNIDENRIKKTKYLKLFKMNKKTQKNMHRKTIKIYIKK